MKTMSGKDALVDLMHREDVENLFYSNIGNPNLEPPEINLFERIKSFHDFKKKL